MPQEKPKKKAMSKTPAGLGAKLGSAVRESFPLAVSPLASLPSLGSLTVGLGKKAKGYMDSKKKKDPSKYIKYLEKKTIEKKDKG